MWHAGRPRCPIIALLVRRVSQRIEDRDEADAWASHAASRRWSRQWVSGEAASEVSQSRRIPVSFEIYDRSNRKAWENSGSSWLSGNRTRILRDINDLVARPHPAVAIDRSCEQLNSPTTPTMLSESPQFFSSSIGRDIDCPIRIH